MINNKYGLFFKICQAIVRVFKPKYTAEINHKTDEPVVYISHHQNLFGPFTTLLWFPITLRCWILNVFLDKEDCYKQYADYTFSKRFGWHQFIANIAAWMVSRFVPPLLNSGKGIPVFRGSKKILKTFQISVTALEQGENVVIFPDVEYSDSSAEVKDLYDGFLYLEKYYYKKTGKHVNFVPLFVSRNMKKIVTAEPISFRDEEDFSSERKIVMEKIQDKLNELALACGDRHE